MAPGVAVRRIQSCASLDMDIDAYPPTERVEGILADAGVRFAWSRRSNDADWAAYGDRYRAAMLSHVRVSIDDPLAPRLRARAGPGWGTYALLHTLLDFVVVVGHPNEASRRRRT